MDNPFVSVIILNFNGMEFLDACIRSVLAQAYSPFEVLVVDNNSTDGSRAFIAKTFPDVRLIISEENLGFAGGNNLGVLRAKGDLVVLLNNDTTVEPGWLVELVKAMQPEDVAVASSFVRTKGIPERYYERNGSINLIGHNVMRVFESPTDLFYAGGTAMIFKRSLIGLPFDDSYFAYSEDVYCSLRARFMGYRIRHVPESVVHHEGGGTSRRTPSSRLTMLQERNRLLNMILFFSWWTLVRSIPFLAANVLVKTLLAILTSRYSLTGILRSYSWFLMHPRWILRKRRSLREEFHRDERDVLSLMTAWLTNGESTAARAINRVAVIYCRLVGLRTIELTQGDRK